ncbi:MAG: glycosyltransferase [Acidobacteria bacterium]|nr:glycosyltransferase [Acidobacteriota bacterium]
MRIAFVIPYFYPEWRYGGQPRSAFELASGLVRRGHRVQVFTLGRDEGARNVEGIEVFYHRNVSEYLARRYRLFWSFSFKVGGADIIHVHELRALTSVAAYRAAMKAGIPYVLSAHGGLRHLGRKSAKTIFDALWGKQILAHAARVIAVSPIEENDASAFGVEPRRLRRIPNAINIEDYASLPVREAFRRRLKIGAGTILLFLGRLHWIKGADLLIDAFNAIRASEPSVHLVIAGPDDGQEASLRRQVRKLGLNERVIFTGFLEGTAKIEALTGSDVLVVPSRSEVFALAAIESLLCGTPVVLSSACGLYPLPKPDHGVIPFEAENRQDLADKLLAMVGPRPFRHNVSAGKAFVVDEFSLNSIAAKAEKVYEEVLHG